MRIYAAALALEANTFSPLPTSYQAFVEKLYFPPGAHPARAASPDRRSGAARAARQRRPISTLVEGSCYAAQPGGPAARAAYERMRDEILGRDRRPRCRSMASVLNLHGAMVAHRLRRLRRRPPRARARARRPGLRDRRRARSALPSDTPEACALRRHHRAVQGVSAHRLRRARRGGRSTWCCARSAGEIKPVKSLFDCRRSRAFRPRSSRCAPSSTEIMTLEGKDDVLSVSIGHCFPYGDVPKCGARILVITDGAKAARRQARRAASAVELIALRESAAPPHVHGRRRDRRRARLRPAARS